MRINSLLFIKQCIFKWDSQFLMVLEQIRTLQEYLFIKGMAAVKSNDSAYTAIRPSRILHSKKLVTSVTEVLQEHYLNPLSPLLDAQQLYNISSGRPVEDSNQVLELLNMRQTGIELSDCFIQDCLVSGVKSFHSQIKRNNLKLFTSTSRTVKKKIGRDIHLASKS